MKYVWLNINTGAFSDSWTEEEQKAVSGVHEVFSEESLKEAKIKGWKLIKYECINDDKFELYNQMKLK